MPMEFGRRSIRVMGTEVELNTSEGLPIVDVDSEMDQVASQMAWWGSVWGAAERERGEADGEYRRWRAAKTLEILAEDPKLAEWKVRAAVEADPKFLAFKRALAATEEHVTIASAVFKAFDKKAGQLQSKGAMMRSELSATGMTTPAEPKSARRRAPAVETARDESETERVKRVREVFRKPKTAKKGD